MEVTEGSAHLLCNQTLSVLDPNTTTVSISINGNLIVTNTSATANTIYAGIVGTTNVTILRTIFSGTSIIQINAILLINEYIDVTIAASCPGYISYKNTIRIYGYDVNNFSHNPFENIVLIKNTLIGSYSNILYLCDPNTNTNYYYNLNSCTGIQSWTENSVVLGTNQNYISNTLLPVSNTVITYNKDNNGNNILSSIVNSCTSTFTPSSIVLYPEYNAYVNTGNSLFDKTQVLNYLVNYTNVTRFLINGTTNMPYASLTLGVEVYDYFLQKVDRTFIKVVPQITDNSVTYYYNLIQLTKATRYRIKYSVYLNQYANTFKTLDLISNSSITIRNLGLNSFRILNNTTTSQVVSIQEFNGTTFVETLNQTLNYNDVLNFVPADGFHKAIINGVTYPFVAYENAANIISNAIEENIESTLKLQCSCGKKSCQCEPFSAYSRYFFLTSMLEVSLKKFFASDLSYSDFRPDFDVQMIQWNSIISSILNLKK